MKTSDKILMWTILTIIGVIAGAQLALYARYKAGDILTLKEIYRQNHLRKELQKPAHLVIRGVDDVHFFKAGTFSIEFEKGGMLKDGFIVPQMGRVYPKRRIEGEEIIQPRYYQSGDTLIIDGYDPRDTADIAFNQEDETDNGRRHTARMLNIFGYAGGDIQLEGGNTHIEGDSIGEGQDYRFVLKRNRLCLTKDEDIPDSILKSSHFKNVVISAKDASEVELDRGINVGNLSLDLDSTSSLQDKGGWTIGQMQLRADDKASLNTFGRFLKKIQPPFTSANR